MLGSVVPPRHTVEQFITSANLRVMRVANLHPASAFTTRIACFHCALLLVQIFKLWRFFNSNWDGMG
jgi:hypothetical protein